MTDYQSSENGRYGRFSMIKFPKAPKLTGLELAVRFLESIDPQLFKRACRELSPERRQALELDDYATNQLKPEVNRVRQH